MSGEIHSFSKGRDEERSVYLDAYLTPFRQWLDRDTVTEIMVNKPGEVWIEDATDPGMKRVAQMLTISQFKGLPSRWRV